jgi:formamidopyrimidine-DNA glycosylase
MPELPEVETVRRGLSRLLPGHRVLSIDSDWPRGFPNSPQDVEAHLVGASVVVVRRRAKVLLIDLSSGYTLVTHLKMTGQLVFRPATGEAFGAGHPNDSLVGALPDKSTRVQLHLDGADLYFNDQRKFGWMRLVPTDQVEDMAFFQKVGPEPLEPEFTLKRFGERLSTRSGSSIKAVLLDQAVLAGVGNIYADEALWAAALHPLTRVRDISTVKQKALYEGLIAVLQLSIDKGGSTDRNYVNAEGQRGSYTDFARVFRREKLPCYRCGATIVKTRVAGRGTHTCPVCQVAPAV